MDLLGDDFEGLYKEVPNDLATQQVLQYLAGKDASLRWDFTFSDAQLESRRVQIYKFLRKRRYLRSMGAPDEAGEKRTQPPTAVHQPAAADSNPYVSREESANFYTRQQLLEAGYAVPGGK